MNALVLAALVLAGAEPARIAVIIDDDLPIYRRVVAGLAVESKAVLEEYTLGGDPTLGPDILERVQKSAPALIVTVGPRALVAARNASDGIPVVYCMVPRLEGYDVAAKNIAGVRLEPSYASQLGALKALLPPARRVGIVHNPSASQTTIDEVSRAAQAQGLEIVPIAVSSAAETAPALERAEKLDALMMISDPTVLNLTSFEAMLGYSRAQKVPLFALNARFVERGALFAFGLDYAQLGRQVGRVSNRVVDGQLSIDKLGRIDPEGLELVVNLQAAAEVGLGETLPSALLDFAAEQETTLRVVRGEAAAAK